VVTVVALCIAALLSASTSADEKKWAQSVVSAAIGALIGYLVRK